MDHEKKYRLRKAHPSTTHTAHLFKTARNRTEDGSVHFLEAEFCCDNPRCTVRQVTISIKEYDSPTPDVFRCPSCGSVLMCHWVRTVGRDDEPHYWKNLSEFVNGPPPRGAR